MGNRKAVADNSRLESLLQTVQVTAIRAMTTPCFFEGYQMFLIPQRSIWRL